MAQSKNGSFALALYMLGFNNYMGFWCIPYEAGLIDRQNPFRL
jgi:hypothetical protein